MRRGEVWRYRGLARQRLVLIVSDDALNGQSEPIVVDVTESGPSGPTALLTVPLGDWGYARCRRVTFVEAARLDERVHALPDDVMEQVDTALRIALSL